MGRPFLEILDSETYCYQCRNCGNHLTTQESFQSDAFQGSSGKAILFSNVANINYSKTEEKGMTTGIHVVRDIFCKVCEQRLGWTYEMAYSEDQRFKEGQYILELKFIRKVCSMESKGQSPPESPAIELLRYDSTYYGHEAEAGMGPAYYAAPVIGRHLQWGSPRGYGGAETPTPRSYRHAARLRRAI